MSGRFLLHPIVLSFVLAGTTGLLFRIGMLTPLPDWLSLQNVRHAHSHLMFFGWAVPLPMYLVWWMLRGEGGVGPLPLRRMKRALAGGLFLGMLSYPSFLLFGYRPLPMGSGSLPLSVMVSGLVMICWYWFMWGWWTARRNLPARPAFSFMDGALLLLLVSSLGAWGVAAAQFLLPESQLLGKALTHFFLACFTEGWVVLSALALLAGAGGAAGFADDGRHSGVIAAIVLGAPLTFAYGISADLLSPLVMGAARAGGLAAGLALCYCCYRAWQGRQEIPGLLLWPLAFLALKGGMQVAASILPGDFLLSHHGLRILYLHVLLLGGFTLAGTGVLYHMAAGLSRHSFQALAAAVTILLASLLLLTPVVPAGWTGGWVFQLLALAALLPVAAMLWVWSGMASSPHATDRSRSEHEQNRR